MGNSIADRNAIDGPFEHRLGKTDDGRRAAQQFRCVEDLVVIVLGRAQEKWRYVNRSLTGYAGGAVGLLFEIQLYGPLLPRQDRKWIVRLERSGLTDRKKRHEELGESGIAAGLAGKRMVSRFQRPSRLGDDLRHAVAELAVQPVEKQREQPKLSPSVSLSSFVVIQSSRAADCSQPLT